MSVFYSFIFVYVVLLFFANFYPTDTLNTVQFSVNADYLLSYLF